MEITYEQALAEAHQRILNGARAYNLAYDMRAACAFGDAESLFNFFQCVRPTT